MSEQPDQLRRPDGEDEPPGGVDAGGADAAGADAGRRENVRTAGETSVDEAAGAGDEPAR
jgi:hypothetical protein